jgi:hypothetical protein
VAAPRLRERLQSSFLVDEMVPPLLELANSSAHPDIVDYDQDEHEHDNKSHFPSMPKQIAAGKNSKPEKFG